MRATELIEKKRDGKELTQAEFDWFIAGHLRDEIKDYQVSAMLMACYLRGLSRNEMIFLIRTMSRSGEILAREKKDSFWIDKHSTGGVGDKVSLILVPIVIALSERLMGEGSVKIPMISGRGLGATGGTLDKLESVPGFNPILALSDLMPLLERQGFFMAGQTPELVPADRSLYSLRDATATVDAVPLIVTSILSKKIAENLDGIVFDVKYGSGAAMKTLETARVLADTLVQISKELGLTAVALLTSMDEPLGRKVGNHLEVEECADFLLGRKVDAGLRKVTFELTYEMLSLANKSPLAREVFEREFELEMASRRPFEIFQLMLHSQGGSWSEFEANSQKFRNEIYTTELRSPQSGYVEKIKAGRVGELLIEMGGGRKRKEDPIDPFVGFEFFKKVGDKVEKGEKIAVVYHRESFSASAVEKELGAAIEISPLEVFPTEWVGMTVIK